jgi:hypothetical protein
MPVARKPKTTPAPAPPPIHAAAFKEIRRVGVKEFRDTFHAIEERGEPVVVYCGAEICGAYFPIKSIYGSGDVLRELQAKVLEIEAWKVARAIEKYL